MFLFPLQVSAVSLKLQSSLPPKLNRQRLLRFNIPAFWSVSFTEEHAGSFRSVCSRWDLSHWQTEQTNSWGSAELCLKSFLLKKEQHSFTVIRSASTIFFVSKLLIYVQVYFVISVLFSSTLLPPISSHWFCSILFLPTAFPSSCPLLLNSSWPLSTSWRFSYHCSSFLGAVWNCLVMISRSCLLM